jgi:hypothetical protein
VKFYIGSELLKLSAIFSHINLKWLLICMKLKLTFSQEQLIGHDIKMDLIVYNVYLKVCEYSEIQLMFLCGCHIFIHLCFI